MREFDIQEFNPSSVSDVGEHIYIFGASDGGKIIYELLKKEGYEITGFYDSHGEKDQWCGLPVKKIDECDIYNDKVIVGVCRSFDSVCKILKNTGFTKAYKCVQLIEKYTVNDIKIEDEHRLNAESFFRDYALYANGFVYEGRVVLPVLEVFITECCTLRCRDCSHLIPFYKKPKSYDVDGIINSVKCILTVVDEIKELMILGGEPLLHSQLSKLLLWCGKQDKIKTVRIITNGTVIPSEKVIESAKKANVEFRISDYGNLSCKLSEIAEICNNEEIAYEIHRELWTDMGNIEYHPYSDSELKDMFERCPFVYVFLLINDRLFRCAHIGHLNNLGFVATLETDSILIDRRKSLKKELEEYLEIDCMEGCRWCNGAEGEKSVIAPAKQCTDKGKIIKI